MSQHRDWYHKIDLGRGLVTPGRDFDDIWNVCRQMMDRVDFRGKRVLDVGACDGLWSFEAERRGAALVVATDLFPYALDRFLFCRRVLKSNVVPLYNVSIYNLIDSLGRYLSSYTSPFAPFSNCFDVVICFGVLYHLRDPLNALSQLRSVVSDGGNVLLETAYIHAETKPVMLFNGGDTKRMYNDVTTWWAPSYSCLQEVCQTSLFKLEEASVATLIQDGLMGRIGALLKPARLDSVSESMGYEIVKHYRTPVSVS